MSSCRECLIIMSEEDYAGEGLCKSCHYSHMLDKETAFDEDDVPEESLEDELSEIVNEIYSLVYGKD